MEVTISSHFGYHYSTAHNNRNFYAAHISPEKSSKNHYYVSAGEQNDSGIYNASLEECYTKVFESAFQEFNQKQRPCRRFHGTYLEKIESSEKRHLNNSQHKAFEVIWQVGNLNDTKDPMFRTKSSKVLALFAKDLMADPNIQIMTKKELQNSAWSLPTEKHLILLNLAMHCDEKGVPHLHATFIAVHHAQRGAKLQNSLSAAFSDMGYKLDYVDAKDTLGNPVYKHQRNGALAISADGEPIIKKEMDSAGPFAWLEDKNATIVEKMKKEFDWDRLYKCCGRKHMTTREYIVHANKAEEARQSLEKDISEEEAQYQKYQSCNTCMATDISSSDALSLEELLESIPSTQEKVPTTTDLWNAYNSSVKGFWNWYHSNAQTLDDALRIEQRQKKKYSLQQQYALAVFYHSHLLIIRLFALLISLIEQGIYLKHLESTEQLIEYRRKLAAVAKDAAAENFRVRGAIRAQEATNETVQNLRTVHTQLEQIYENYIEK